MDGDKYTLDYDNQYAGELLPGAQNAGMWDIQLQDGGELPLIDPEMFFDLLMEQQEQM